MADDLPERRRFILAAGQQVGTALPHAGVGLRQHIGFLHEIGAVSGGAQVREIRRDVLHNSAATFRV